LTGEALAVLPRVNNLGMLFFFYVRDRFNYLLLIIVSGHNLVHHRRKATPPVPQSSSFIIPESFTKDYRNKDRLLLYDSDDLKFGLKQLGQGHFCKGPFLRDILCGGHFI
jgi:hypothetical protein